MMELDSADCCRKKYVINTVQTENHAYGFEPNEQEPKGCLPKFIFVLPDYGSGLLGYTCIQYTFLTLNSLQIRRSFLIESLHPMLNPNGQH
jgi:hypothetical protein